MEVQLQELVEKIRKDGVETAEAKSAEIIRAAQERADALVRSARAEADAIVANAKAEAERNEKAGIASMAQAGRNLLISFRDGITAELESIVSRETQGSYDAQVLKDLIPKAVAAWIEKTGEDDLAVILPKADLDRLESSLTQALKAEIGKGVTLRGDKNLPAGFRIATKNGSAYYDFSADAVADLFSAYVSPRVAEALKSAAKGL